MILITFKMILYFEHFMQGVCYTNGVAENLGFPFNNSFILHRDEMPCALYRKNLSLKHQIKHKAKYEYF